MPVSYVSHWHKICRALHPDKLVFHCLKSLKHLPILHYALKPSGFLVLGSSESVSAFPDLFSTVDKKHKIYGKKPAASRLSYDFDQPYFPAGNRPQSPGNAPKTPASSMGEIDMQAEVDRVVLKNHSPAEW
jgi:two-component system, chemotaxis family, CheB/CheR fusion protein